MGFYIFKLSDKVRIGQGRGSAFFSFILAARQSFVVLAARHSFVLASEPKLIHTDAARPSFSCACAGNEGAPMRGNEWAGEGRRVCAQVKAGCGREDVCAGAI